MSVRDWLGNRRGEWYVVAQGVLLPAALLAPILDGGPATAAAVAADAVLCAAGVAFIVAGSVGLGRSISPFPKPREDAVLVRRGVFALVRHPIYSGFIGFVLGWSLAWRSLATFIGALVLLAFFDLKARREERWLQARYAEYDDYRRRVSKLIPFVY